MANRYWVGGSGTWDATSTANWSETSGGAGGASAPTSLDDVYFDSGSDTGVNFTVTVGTGAVCKTLNANTASPLDFTMTLAGSAALSIYGSLYFPVTRLTRTYSGEIRFLSGTSDNIISTNGVSLGSIRFDNVAGKWTLGGNLTCGTITFTNGWIDTSSSSYNLSSPQIISENYSASSYRRLTLNSSIFSAQGYTHNYIEGVNFIFEPGTSTVRFSGGGRLGISAISNWYNLELIPVHYGIVFASAPALTTAHSITFYGAGNTRAVHWTGVPSINTNYLTFKDSGVGHRHVQLSGDIAVNELFKTESTNGSNRWAIESSVTGVNRTITAKAVELTDVDFKNITAAGESGTWSGTRIGNAGGNVNINFTPPKTVYWNRPAGGAWNSLAWATTSGGTPSLELVPLPQDTAIIEDTGLNSGATISIYSWNTPNINATSRTLPFTFSIANTEGFSSNRYNPEFCGDLLLNNNCTLADTGSIYLRGLSNQNVSLPSSFSNSIVVDKLNSDVNFSNSFTTTGSFTLTSGIVNFLSNASVLTFTSSNTNARTLNIGANNLTISGTAWNTITSTNLTLLGTGKLVFTSTSEKTFAGGNADYGNIILRHAGMGNLNIGGFNTLGGIDNAIASTAGSSIIFGGNGITKIRGKVRLSGTNSSPLILASPSGTTFTLTNLNTASIQQLDYVTISNSIAAPADNWYAGTRSTVTNSTGWSNTFSSAADLFWVGGSGTWDSSTNTNWAVISGGTGGTIAPTSTNNITFDSNSDAGSAFTVTVGTGAVCKTFSANSENPLDQAMTLAGTASCSINESLLLPSVNFTRTYTGIVNFVGTPSKLINTNGVSFDNNFNFSGVATYNFQSSFTNSSSKDIYFNAGIINTNNFNVSSSRFFLTSANLQQVNLGSSTITISGGVLTGWQVDPSATNLALNSGTSLLRFSYTYGSLLDNRTSGSNRVYYNVEFINSSHNIISDITCNNLTMANANDFIRLRGNLTVNGTLTVLASTLERCVNFYSDALGSTVTANAVNFSRVFFKDITAAGASAPWIGQLGDMGNNNNIQFPAPKTVYWRSTIGGSYVYSNSWGFTPTGAIDVNAIPLPQDTGVILDNFPSSGQSIFLGWRDMTCGLDFSQRTQPVTLNSLTFGSSLMGDLILSSSVSFGSTLQSNRLEFYPNLRDIQFNPAGQTITFPISIRSGMNFESTTARTPSINYGLNILGTFNSTKSISVLAGTLNSNNFELSCTNFDSSGSLTRAINLGTSKVNVSGNWNLATSTNLSFTGSGTINMSGTSAKTFAGGGANYSGVILNQGGSGELTVTGNNQFGGISNTVRPASIKFTAGSTTTLGKFMLNGSDGAPVAISSTTTGTRYTLTSTAGVFAPYYTSIRDSNATGGAVWRAPINYGNVNVSNNLGWDFSNINIMTDNFMVLFPSNLHLTS